MYNLNNVFSDYFQKFNNVNPFSNVNNLGFDQQGISNMFKHGLEFWNATIQDCVVQAQQIINNNVEVIEKNNKEVINAFDDLANTNNFEQAFAKQQQLVTKIIDNNIDYSKRTVQQVSDIANENVQKYNKKTFNNQQ